MTKPRKQRCHRFVIAVTFNKPISRRRALEQARDVIDSGPYYPIAWVDADPGEMRVRSITDLPKGNRHD